MAGTSGGTEMTISQALWPLLIPAAVIFLKYRRREYGENSNYCFRGKSLPQG